MPVVQQRRNVRPPATTLGIPTAWLSAGVRTLRDLAFPPVCMHCGGLCEDSSLRHVCRRCDPLIVRVGSPHCPTCGHPYFGVVEGERICPHCEGLSPAYREARTLTLLKGPARDLVLGLKYRAAFHVLGDLESLARANAEFADFIRGATLVPVPLHPRKERERGYNQSLLLAEAFVRAVDGGANVQTLLRRVEDTETQTFFDRRARRERMKNAFAPVPGADITPRHRYILVDDVFTTGSTLNACARVLRRAGALNLDVVTFGHG
jgi:ComF family protein